MPGANRTSEAGPSSSSGGESSSSEGESSSSGGESSSSGGESSSSGGESNSSGGNNAGARGSSERPRAVIQDLERFKCPICLEFPRAAVYLCSDGHSVCSLCVEKLNNCPTCRAPYVTGRGSKRGRQRNHLAEDFLDTVQFDCTWRERGCQRRGLSRQRLSVHAEKCQFNPHRVKLCQMLLLGTTCAFKVAPAYLRSSIRNMPADFLDHLWNTHRKRVWTALSGVGYCQTNVRAISTNARNSFFHGHLLQLKERQSSPYPAGYFMVICYKDKSVADPKLSWFVVRITDQPQWLSVNVKFSLKSYAPPFPNDAGDDAVWNSDTRWQGQIMGLQELDEFRRKAAGEREKFKFSLPLSHLREYYLNAEGELELDYKFTVTPINNVA